MDNIDFLPDHYRNHRTELNDRFSHWIVCALFMLGISAAVIYQKTQKSKADDELQSLTHRHDAAQLQIAKFGRLQTELATHRIKADLITRLKTPWPRSVILYTVFEPLPKCITISSCEISDQSNARQKARGHRSTRPNRQTAKSETLDPTQQDLKEIIEQLTSQRTVVKLSGNTTDTEKLHQFLGSIADHRLVISAKLTSLERDKKTSSSGNQSTENTAVFEVKIKFKPTIGIPGGPVLKEKPVPIEKNNEKSIVNL